MSGEKQIKTRSEWMLEEGREFYDKWLRMVLEYADDTQLMYDLDATRRHRILRHLAPRDQRLSEITDLGVAMRQAMIEADDYMLSNNISPLLTRFDEVGSFTSVRDFMTLFQTDKQGLSAHNKDSIEFAVNMTLGMAFIAEEKLNRYEGVDSPVRTYETFAEILRDPEFHALLEDFSFTGFAVHGQKTAGQILSSQAEKHIVRRYGFSSTSPLFLAGIDENGKRSFTIPDEIKGFLHEQIRIQNKNGVERVNGDEVWMRRATSGCPVRRPAQEQNESAIAALSNSLAKRVEKYMNVSARRNAGGAACRASEVRL